MNIDLVCFSKFVSEEACDYTNPTRYRLPKGGTVADIATQAGIDHRDVKIAFVNRRIASLDTVLNDGDRVGLAPAVGGM
jgi:molybdopterin converting factor small subunit